MQNDEQTPTPTRRSYAGRSSDDRRSERRERLIAAATEVYGSSGYRTATVKAVCQQAGLTERYFYESFASSEELLCDACAEAMQRMRMLAVAAADQAGDAPPARMWASTLSYFSAIKANPAAARLTLFEVEGVSPYADERLRLELEKTIALIHELHYAWLPTPPDEQISTHLLASGFLGVLYQYGKEWTRSGFLMPPETLVRHMNLLYLGTLQQLKV